MYNKSLLFVFSTITLTLLIIIMGLVIKFNYFDEKEHFFSSQCDINNCLMTLDTCCRARDSDPCKICYHSYINYTLIVPNNESYTKLEYYNTIDPIFCDYHNISCYYDNRSILTSLRILKPYIPLTGIRAMGLLGPFIFMSFILCLILLEYNYKILSMIMNNLYIE